MLLAGKVFTKAVLILSLRPANERRRYKVIASFIGWAQTYNQGWVPDIYMKCPICSRSKYRKSS